MLLTIDIGNTNVVWGLFEESTLRGHWRLATESRRTDNEYGILLLNLLHNAGFTPQQITGCILSSVVPALTGTFDALVQTYFHQTHMDSDIAWCAQVDVTHTVPQGVARTELGVVLEAME